jgi:hypothetical protein
VLFFFTGVKLDLVQMAPHLYRGFSSPGTNSLLGQLYHTTGNYGFANSPELSQQPRPELLAKKIFPNRKTLLSGKKSLSTAQNPKTDGKVRLLAKGFFPNSIPVGKEQLLAKPRRGQTVPTPSASPTASPLAVGKGNSPSPKGLPCC